MAEKDVENFEDRIEELENELRKVKNRGTDEQIGKKQSSSISRRDFLKKATGGTAALGAAAMIPSASSFTLKDDKPFKFGNLSSSQSNFEVGKKGNLDLHGNDITNVGQIGSTSNPSSATVDQIVHTESVVRGYKIGSGGMFAERKISDYADIGAAINSVCEESNFGAIIELPAGEFSYSTDINLTVDNIVICGKGGWNGYGTQLDYTGSGKAIVPATDAYTALQFFELTGPGKGTTGGPNDGTVGFDQYGGAFVFRVVIDGFETGIRLNGESSIGPWASYYKNCNIDNCGIAIKEEDSEYAPLNGAVISQNRFQRNGQCIVTHPAYGLNIKNNILEGNIDGGPVIELVQFSGVDKSEGLAIADNYFESNDSSLIQIQGLRNARIVGNYMNVGSDIPTDGYNVIKLLDARNISVRENSIEASNAPGSATVNGVQLWGSQISTEDVKIYDTDMMHDLDAIVNSLGGYQQGVFRTTIEGWSENSGDPSSTGEWNGEGREGMMVRDTSNSNNYIYKNGGWRSI